MRPGSRAITPPSFDRAALVTLLTALLVAALLPLAVAGSAAAATPTALSLSAPASYADRDTTLTISLDASGVPVAAAPVVVERWDGAAWQPVGSGPVTTDVTGTATLAVPVDRSPERNRLRASYAGDEANAPTSVEYVLLLTALPTSTTLTGPASVIDEQTVSLRLTWKTVEGTGVLGRVYLQQYVSGVWRWVTTVGTNAAGYVDVRVTPRVDTRWRAVTLGLPWAAPSASVSHRIDNLPSGVPVALPASAPRPRIVLPAQPRATGAGAYPVISTISDAVWRSMVGRSWHRGCPVGRSGLRILRINYWDYQGYRRRGEIVAAASAIRQMAAALSDMYRAKLPIRAMYRVDRFGWSKRVNGADDYKSMAAGNTSAFNCRWVVGRPGVRSPHSYGRSLDLNTWENPYRSRLGWVPNAWWPSRSHPRVAWRSRTHPVVRIMANHGLRWSYATSDSQHFDAVTRNGRVIVVPGCGVAVCH
ncbi:M15 family metallopeptidase [Nocardioides sp. WS12]|uniref:M15 family metallopeptidase n=1 Tax=Nocardioides sp. WS12 TaxID=2486272 RepID=UPI0015FE6183|nr:M15 family metallopeptidase [Nocardioides sp. WS12]